MRNVSTSESSSRRLVSTGKSSGRRLEVTVLVLAAAACALIAIWARSAWLEEERWGDPIAVQPVSTARPIRAPAFNDFSAIWEPGGRNPFGDAAVALESGGKAQIAPPPLPPLEPEAPPAPAVRPIDLFSEGSR